MKVWLSRFVVAVLAVMALGTVSARATETGISLNDAVPVYRAMGVDLVQTTDNSGNTHWEGQSKSGLIYGALNGDVRDLGRAVLLVGISQETLPETSVHILRFMQFAIPGLPQKEAEDTFRKAVSGGAASISRNGRVLDVSTIKGMVTLAVTKAP